MTSPIEQVCSDMDGMFAMPKGPSDESIKVVQDTGQVGGNHILNENIGDIWDWFQKILDTKKES